MKGTKEKLHLKIYNIMIEVNVKENEKEFTLENYPKNDSSWILACLTPKQVAEYAAKYK